MDLQFIVGKLKEKPFSIDIRAVDFDEKTPDEHLQILNDVLATLDQDLKADIRSASREDVVDQMLQFLLIHKCPLIPSSEDQRFGWIDGIRHGDKVTLYQVLHWVLSNYATLGKRAYLSQYLMPVDVPPEYLMQNNANTEDLLDAYKDLQDEFVEVHKQYESMMANVDRPASDIISGIKQMEAEEQQLLHRLHQERNHTRNNTSFQRLLAEASEMRLSQDKEIGLEDQKGEQLHHLAKTKRKVNQARRLLDLITPCEAKPIESILTDLEHESRNAIHHLESNVMQQRHHTELKLLQAEKEADLDTTEYDSEYAVEMAAQLEEKQDELEKIGDNHIENDSELSALKKDANDATTKSEATSKLYDTKAMEKELLLSTNKELRESIHAVSGGEIQRPDGTCMDKHEFAEFQESVNRIEIIYDESKQEVAQTKDEISELKLTEDAIKEQYHDLQVHVHQEEERAGVTGYQEINDRLKATSKQTASINALKSQALEDISVMVQQIAQTLDSKKQELEPKIEELKQKRKQFHELKEKHQREKARYDDIVANVTNDNRSIESDCSRLPKEWLEKERDLNLLVAKHEIEASKLDVLPSLGRLKELYESEIAKQQDLAKELRVELQIGTKQSEEYKSNQIAIFSNLKKLLELKAG